MNIMCKQNKTVKLTNLYDKTWNAKSFNKTWCHFLGFASRGASGLSSGPDARMLLLPILVITILAPRLKCTSSSYPTPSDRNPA